MTKTEIGLVSENKELCTPAVEDVVMHDAPSSMPSQQHGADVVQPRDIKFTLEPLVVCQPKRIGLHECMYNTRV